MLFAPGLLSRSPGANDILPGCIDSFTSKPKYASVLLERNNPVEKQYITPCAKHQHQNNEPSSAIGTALDVQEPIIQPQISHAKKEAESDLLVMHSKPSRPQLPSLSIPYQHLQKQITSSPGSLPVLPAIQGRKTQNASEKATARVHSDQISQETAAFRNASDATSAKYPRPLHLPISSLEPTELGRSLPLGEIHDTWT
jgi:hypothetical protein